MFVLVSVTRDLNYEFTESRLVCYRCNGTYHLVMRIMEAPGTVIWCKNANDGDSVMKVDLRWISLISA